MFRKLLLYLLISIPSFSTTKADSDFFFSHLGVKDGLSQISVIKIFQDSDSYLWFGTRNGLNKYDGYEFKTFRNELDNPESLSDRYIKDIKEDKNKNIWVSTQNGLNCIEHLTERIHRFYPTEIDSLSTSDNISLLLSHTDGSIYMVQGTNVFICHSDISVSHYKHLDPITSSLRSIAQDPVSGDIYIGTDSGGLLIYSSGWELKNQLKPEEYSMLHSVINTLLVDKEGVWIGTEESGVCYLNQLTGEMTNYNNSNSDLGNNTVRSIIFMNEDSVLIGTFSGLNILNRKNHKVSALSVKMKGQGSLSHYSIHSMLLDKDQTLWLGTYSAGINYHSPYYKQISYIIPQMYTGIMGKGVQDKDGCLWFATEGSGLFYYNPQTHEQEIYPLKPLHHTNYERNIIKYILLSDDSDEILCTTHFGSVYSFSMSKKTYQLLYDYKENDIYSLYFDSKGRLWIPVMTNPYTVVIEKGNEISSFPVNGKKEKMAPTTVIYEIEDDIFLMGGFNTLFLYDWENGSKQNLIDRLPEPIQKELMGTVSSILSDSSFIWVSTTKLGILKFSHDLQFMKQYLPDDGLSDSYVTSMVIDHKGDIWAATVTEIFRHNKQNDHFLSIKQTGIPQQEFTLHAGTISSDGIIYFPASQGVLAINPNKMQGNPTIPPLYITSLFTNNNENILNQMRVDSSDKMISSIKLKASQNHLMIRYAALNFIHSGDNQYMFRMDGVDNNWQNVGNRRDASYNNLYPGTYTFRVKAANNDGLWNPKETMLTITVFPPFYKTWWAYTLYIIIILILSFQIYRYQHRKHELERDIRYRQKEQERMKELHDERLRMFNNFAHELRTPLTLIINPLEEVMQNISFSQEIKQALKRMKKNTQRMLMLVNNLMDIQRYEAGQSKLNKKSFTITAFIDEIFQSFQNIATRRQIRFTCKNELPDNYLVYYDETEIEKVFFNLLSNAFKYTPQNGTVTLIVRQAQQEDFPDIAAENPYLYIEVKDSGKGFSQEESKKIFEPFYSFKGDVHQEISGTGIGLSLTRSIVSLHNGIIWAECSEEKGTRFMFLLPDTETQRQEKNIHPYIPSSETAEITKLLLEEVDTRKKQTLIIVDDDSDICEYLEQQLNNEYKVITATNGKEALGWINKTHPHLVISDIIMPEMSGIELCRVIKNTPGYAHIPVILLTAKSSVSQIEEGLDIGADDYITKPFQISLLKARIRNILSSQKKKTIQEEPANILQTLGINIEAAKDDFLVQYIQIVKENISNPELDISLIYGQLGISRANFYRKVKSLTGLSPIDLIRNIRLEAGAGLLRDTDLNISEIAQKTGFSSRSYFARNFKVVYGLSPTEYQEKNKKPL